MILFAWHHRYESDLALLLRRYLIHGLLSITALLALGWLYQHFSFLQMGDHALRDGHWHFWLTFLGIVGLMSREWLLPQAITGWTYEALQGPGPFFLAMLLQVVIQPLSVLLLIIGQAFFCFQFGSRRVLAEK